MTKKSKEQLEKERSGAGDRRDWDAADKADAELEKLEANLSTEPAPPPPKDAEDSVRPELGDPLPPAPARLPRGPFVRYHETDERSCLAVVTAVHEDGSVNLHVFPDGPRTNYLQKVPNGYDAGCWEDYL